MVATASLEMSMDAVEDEAVGWSNGEDADEVVLIRFSSDSSPIELELDSGRFSEVAIVVVVEVVRVAMDVVVKVEVEVVAIWC